MKYYMIPQEVVMNEKELFLRDCIYKSRMFAYRFLKKPLTAATKILIGVIVVFGLLQLIIVDPLATENNVRSAFGEQGIQIMSMDIESRKTATIIGYDNHKYQITFSKDGNYVISGGNIEK